MKYRHPKQINEFRKRFPGVSGMFTAPAKGELTDIEQFLDEQLEKARLEGREQILNLASGLSCDNAQGGLSNVKEELLKFEKLLIEIDKTQTKK